MNHVGTAALAGLIGGLAFLVVVWDAVLGGIFEFGYLRELGTVVRRDASPQATVGLGVAGHGVLSVTFASVYAWVIELSGTTSVGTATSIALLLGLAQGVITSGLFGSILGRTHPGLRHLRPIAQRFGRHPGSATTAWIAAHAVYGITVGAVYAAAAR